ncbi:FCD domain-containing protein [Mesorhizobium sp. M7A.F.Ca.US.011.01.1.1]|uniref:flavodoxin domain-containing protein n=1 Tax=Mesorhizobium sp. M7A.F.Ca.US.011.01.1.1 TaxID=2496741 RepID=UPI000FCCAEAC|nr:flavodoxin domain-containing protein [Mesorhizobium sp. M7A.F.Ca.US.011.01.1.1]RUX24059.1 FCD domain-containing protein [Mesorhizobium sp. M7A.F.Ca.US.011.01.1.1]
MDPWLFRRDRPCACASFGDIASPSASDHSGSAAPAAVSSRSLTILFGGETGNSSGLGKALGEAVRRQGFEPALIDMADYKPRKLKDEQDILIITRTHGEGDPPLSGMGFFEFVESRKAPCLEGVRYAVLALGDSTYERYCEAGKRLDRRLAELGTVRLQDRVDCGVDYEDEAAGWIATAVTKLAPATFGPGLPNRTAGSASASTANFYEKFFDAAGKRIAWEIVQGLNVRINQLRSMTITSTNRRESAIREMTAIMNAIKSRDPNKAAAAARHQVEQAWSIAQQLLRSR